MKNSIVTNIKVETPFYAFDGFKITIERIRNGKKIINIYDGVSDSSIRRLRMAIPTIRDWNKMR